MNEKQFIEVTTKEQRRGLEGQDYRYLAISNKAEAKKYFEDQLNRAHSAPNEKRWQWMNERERELEIARQSSIKLVLDLAFGE